MCVDIQAVDHTTPGEVQIYTLGLMDLRTEVAF